MEVVEMMNEVLLLKHIIGTVFTCDECGREELPIDQLCCSDMREHVCIRCCHHDRRPVPASGYYERGE